MKSISVKVGENLNTILELGDKVIIDSSTTTFMKAGLAKNTTYKFRVCAYYMSGKTALYGGYGSVSGKTLAK